MRTNTVLSQGLSALLFNPPPYRYLFIFVCAHVSVEVERQLAETTSLLLGPGAQTQAIRSDVLTR